MIVRCPYCGESVDFADGPLGRDVECPRCGRQNVIDPPTASYHPKQLIALGHFVLLEHIGTGRFGEVFKAEDTKLKRIVALKVPRGEFLDEATCRQFLHEARAAAKLRHPNIVTIHEIGTVDNRIYIASDFIEGCTLSEYVASHQLTICQIVDICIQVGDALLHAHQNGVIHRDLKPGNIIVDAHGHSHIVDFGLAKEVSGDSTVTADGVVVGTPFYMSPEQARGESRNADGRSDIFSLGVIMYQMLTGKLPFTSASVHGVLDKIRHAEPVAPRRLNKRIPRDLETICLKALAKEPRRRYQTALEMVEDLQRFRSNRPIRAKRVGCLGRISRWIVRNRALAITLLAIFLLGMILLGIGGIHFRQRQFQFRQVVLDTTPPGAYVVFVPIDPTTGDPIPEKVTRPKMSPVTQSLLPGDYLVVAYLPDGRFHEVYRHVPKDKTELPTVYSHRWWKYEGGNLVLHTVVIPPQFSPTDMALIPGGEVMVRPVGFSSPGSFAPAVPGRTFVPSFFMHTQEVTTKAFYGQALQSPRATECWPEELHDDEAVVCVTFDQAVAYAEKLGKRLPTQSEFLLAASLLVRQRLPGAKNSASWTFGPVSEDGGEVLTSDLQHPVKGLLSNVAEWTITSTIFPGAKESPGAGMSGRVVWGATLPILERKPEVVDFNTSHLVLHETCRKPGLGFRCVRSVKPRINPEDFPRAVTIP